MDFLKIVDKYSHKMCAYGTDKTAYHSYGNLYNAIVNDLKMKSEPAVLEIGIYSGSFLQALREFLGDRALIVGLDIDLSHFKFNREDFILYEQKATDRTIDGQYDLIIDDGSHQVNDQIGTCRLYIDRLKAGGKYIIEDIADENIFHVLNEIASQNGMLLQKLDFRRQSGVYDDLVAVFTRV